ncbi:MAG TPA: DUF6311 domain-containing protein [Noviherbaspirillum sp.]|uniref:DUF6311 domain-containing protein n=1 Tax=Noviherbaspirillum sp. TaxID=1926288 RepID=UPI002B468DD1|nr:DUF6311 domain-containing protein [Noviherbaspirillum sp.]HJV84298.1 DUF6311 domain-containing protein [Noviherbaspirillum sp.]
MQRPNPALAANSRLLSFLWQDLSPASAYGLATFIALVFIWHIYPLSSLLGHGRFFEEGDASQHVAGWLFYVRDSWHFPLLHTERLNHPDGVSIAFTDSIPLAALLFKPFARWLPDGFHYLGLWQAVAFLTQAIAAMFLMRALGVRHLLAGLAAVLFAVTWPALLFRGAAHIALMTHSLILFSLAFYFLGRGGRWSGKRTTVAFIAVNVIGLVIHPYFLAFCYALFIAFLADQALAREGWMKQVPRLLASVVVICAVGYVLGYFGQRTQAAGFGIFSMNVFAPFCASDLGGVYWCPFDGSGSQGEGFNYLGAGALVMLFYLIATQWEAIKAQRWHYPALVTILVLFVVYALSNTVYAGPFKVLTYALPELLDRLTGTFRVSGRFFWVPGYMILFGMLAALLRKPSWRGVAVLAIALPLQWVDGEHLRDRLSTNAARPGSNDLAPWTGVAANIEKIHIYPAFGCQTTNDTEVYWFFQRVAARYGKLLDTGYIARPNVDCAKNRQEFEAPFLERHLYVMSAELLATPAAVPAGFGTALQAGNCSKWENAILCQPRLPEHYWQTTGLGMEQVSPMTAGTGK